MKSKLALFALLALAPLPAKAADVPYTHVDVAFISVDTGAGSGDGIGIDGSFAFTDSIYGVLGFSDIESSSTFHVGVGWHTGIGTNVDLFAEGGLVMFEAGPFDDDGLFVGVGVRGMATERVELLGRVDIVDLGGGSDSSVTFGGVYYFEKVGAFLEFTADDGADAVAIGARFRF